MKNKVIIPSIIFVVILFFSIFVLMQNKAVSQAPKDVMAGDIGQPAEQVILFYGDGCPHCALVEKYIAENDVATKIPFVKKEVYYNDKNAEELAAKAKICGLPTDSIGVPFLWDGSKCLVGDQYIIDFFKENMSQK